MPVKGADADKGDKVKGKRKVVDAGARKVVDAGARIFVAAEDNPTTEIAAFKTACSFAKMHDVISS